MNFRKAACIASDWFATPVALISVPGVCATWLLLGGSVDTLTLVLSVLALTLSQLVLVGQGVGEAAMQAKLDELIHAVPDASDEVAGIEG